MTGGAAGALRVGLALASVALLAMAAVVALLAAGKAIGPSGRDFELRWQEMQYLQRGIDPNLMFFELRAAHRPHAGPPYPVARSPFQSDLVVSAKAFPIGVYPPWAHTLALPVGIVPELDRAKRVFLALNLALAAAVLAWTWRRLRPLDIGLALAAVAALASFAAFRSSIAVGNYGIVVAALLVGALALVETGRPRPLAAGTLLGIAMLKPTLAGPFVLPFLVERRLWPALASATGVVALATLAFHGYTRTNPLESFLASVSHLDYFVTRGGGVPALVDRLKPVVAPVHEYWSLLAFASGAAVTWFARRRAVLERFAIAAVVAMVWTYHRGYDETILLFPFVALLVLAWRCRLPRAPFATPRGLGALAAATALWFVSAAPAALVPPSAHLAVQSLWLACLATLLWPRTARRVRTDRRGAESATG